MSEKVHLDGRVQDLDGARIPVTDHGFLFGDSIFETMRASRGACAFAARHLARLRRSAEAVRLALPWTDAELLAACRETLAASGEADAAVRLVVTRGSGPLEPDPTRCREPRLIVFVRARPAYPPAHYDPGIALATMAGARSEPGAHVKTGNYLVSVVALGEARERGAFEAVLCNAEGRVTECATSNLFVVTDGRVRTPRVAEGLLPGVTRGVVLECCADAGIEAVEDAIWPEELRGADEAFITSTLKEVMPVREVDGARLPGPGPVTRALRERYLARRGADVARATA